VASAPPGKQPIDLRSGDHRPRNDQPADRRPADIDLKAMFGRLEAVRREVEQLRGANGMGPFEEIDPKWTGLIPWRPDRDG
jgi:hypothetical protein